MVKTKTEQAIIDALEAVAPQHDVDIVDVELVGATKAPCVRVRIEGAEGSEPVSQRRHGQHQVGRRCD